PGAAYPRWGTRSRSPLSRRRRRRRRRQPALAREGLAQDLRRVLGPATGQVLNLLTAGDAGSDDLRLGRRGLHGRGQAPIAERDRDVVVLLLEAGRARK